jgi:hypothetical protein
MLYVSAGAMTERSTRQVFPVVASLIFLLLRAFVEAEVGRVKK